MNIQDKADEITLEYKDKPYRYEIRAAFIEGVKFGMRTLIELQYSHRKEECEYCKQIGGSKLPAEPNFADISITTGTIEIRYDAYSVDSSFTSWIEIKFCPMCGRNLYKV